MSKLKVSTRLRPWSGLNWKAGQTAPWEIEIPEGFILVIDTREQEALFLTHGSGIGKHIKGELLTLKASLPIGDYSIRGFEIEICIERKSIPDLCGSLFGDWERFKKELDKLSRYPRKWLVIEGLESDCLKFQDFSRVHPNSLAGRLCSIEVRLGIPIYYGETRLDCERFVLSRLVKYFNLKRSGEI